MSSVVTIIIPTKKINNLLIGETLPAIDKLIYKDYETIIIVNQKTAKDDKIQKKYSWLKILFSKNTIKPADKRDLGAKQARGDTLAFIDDDAYPAQTWLTNALHHFQHRGLKNLSQQSKSSIQAVCGPGILPKKTNIWEKIFDEVLTSPIGSGKYNYRFSQQKARYIDDYPSMNFLIKKDVFNRLGGFNSKYWPGEDSKLCEDLIYKEKGAILYDPKVLVYHHRRDNLLDFLKQHANYGFHRGAFFAHGDRNSRQYSYFIPTLFISYLIFLVFSFLLIAKYQILIFLPLIFYLILMFFLSIKSYINTRNIFIASVSPLVLFFTHFVYGIMFIKGLIFGLIKKDKIYQ